jgi:hypothetical protein
VSEEARRGGHSARATVQGGGGDCRCTNDDRGTRGEARGRSTRGHEPCHGTDRRRTLPGRRARGRSERGLRGFGRKGVRHRRRESPGKNTSSSRRRYSEPQARDRAARCPLRDRREPDRADLGGVDYTECSWQSRSGTLGIVPARPRKCTFLSLSGEHQRGRNRRRCELRGQRTRSPQGRARRGRGVATLARLGRGDESRSRIRVRAVVGQGLVCRRLRGPQLRTCRGSLAPRPDARPQDRDLTCRRHARLRPVRAGRCRDRLGCKKGEQEAFSAYPTARRREMARLRARPLAR